MREQINIADAKKGDILYVEWEGNGKGIIDYTELTSHSTKDANYSIGIIISMGYTVKNGTMANHNRFYKATEEEKTWLNICRSGYVPLSDVKSIINNIEYILI